MTYPHRGKCLLQNLLDKSNMTQTELAKKTGISQRMISYYASDKTRMNIDVAYVIAKALNCRIDDLYTWSE